MHCSQDPLVAPGPGQPSPRSLQTAKMNDVDPHACSPRPFERIAQGWPIFQIDQLMP
jgi:hypothetical protein